MMSMKTDINKASQVIFEGGVVLYPTDTIWGIGCDATNEEAVDKIYKIKGRDSSKSMIVLVDDIGRIPSYVREMPDVAWDLIELSTSPLTVMFPGAKNLAPNVVAEDESVGIRVVQDEFCQKLIQKVKKPIVSTSANISNKRSPNNFSDISREIIQQMDYVVSYRQNEKRRYVKPSGIIKVGMGGEVEVIRE